MNEAGSTPRGRACRDPGSQSEEAWLESYVKGSARPRTSGDLPSQGKAFRICPAVAGINPDYA